MKKFNLTLILLSAFLGGCSQSVKTSSQDKSAVMQNESLPVVKTEEEWKKQLSPEQYRVLREKGTEAPFTGTYYRSNEKGIYVCGACGNELFSSDMKFESSCGWPSFDKELTGGKIIQKTDNSLGMSRTEILCARCGSHLGHIFDDGPTETGKRYCVNSVSLGFKDIVK